jgi:hypothetical protein
MLLKSAAKVRARFCYGTRGSRSDYDRRYLLARWGTFVLTTLKIPGG